MKFSHDPNIRFCCNSNHKCCLTEKTNIVFSLLSDLYQHTEFHKLSMDILFELSQDAVFLFGCQKQQEFLSYKTNNDVHYLLIAPHAHTKFHKFSLDIFKLSQDLKFSRPRTDGG